MVRNTLTERPKNKATIAKQKIAARLSELKGLSQNWDEDGAEAVSGAAMALAKIVADQLIGLGVNIEFCVPLRNGGVQFEFQKNGDCEVEVHPDETLFFLRYDHAANLIEKEKIILDLLKNHVG